MFTHAGRSISDQPTPEKGAQTMHVEQYVGKRDHRFAAVREAKQAVESWRETRRQDWEKIRSALRKANETPMRTAIGLVALFIWPCLVAMNIVVLAPILELFNPASGEPLWIPVVGPVQPLALLLSLIVAFVEMIAAI